MISGFPDSSLQSPGDPVGVGRGETPISAVTPKVQVGAASWYGSGFNGKTTASGEVFDESKFTAAHKTFPVGSKARVINLNNGKSVEVLINDRGPHVAGRIIDLSQAAAKALGMIDRGVAQVQIELLQETVAAGNALTINRQ